MKNNNKHKILAINDNPDQLELLAYILREAGYQVVTADSGNRGLEAARRELPDLIISDVMMNDGDGIELCRMIRADQKVSLLPILLLSALRKDTESVLEGLEAGADDYVEIPYIAETLIAKASRLIERKLTADILHESENRFRNLIENLTDVISILTPDGTIIYESPSVEHVFGYKPEELLGKNAFDFVHPEDYCGVIEYFAGALRNPEIAQPIDYRFRHKDDSWRIVESVGKKFVDDVYGLVTIINSRDITAQRNALEAQRESEKRLQTIFDNAAIGMALIDSELRAIQSNPALQNMLGYTGEELRQISFAEITHPDDIARTIPLAREAVEGKRNHYRIEKRYVKKNGEIMWANLTVSSISNNAGDKPHVIGMIEDITERKLAETALRESEESYRILAETASDAFITINTDSIILFINRAGEKIFGYPVEEMFGQPLTMLMPESMRDAHYAGIRRYLETGKKNISWNSMEVTALHREGHEFPLELSFGEHQEGNHFFIGVARDITKRKQAENALCESKEHLALAQEVGRIGSFEFDLQTNEAKSSSALEVLYGVATGGLSQKIEDWIKYIHPEDRSKVTEEMERIMDTGKHDTEFRIIQNDGSVRWLYSKGKVFYDDEGIPLRLVGVNMDVTEHKLAETALAEAGDRAIREYVRLLERLAALGQKLGTARDLTAVFSAILEFTLASVPCSALFISLYNKERSTRKGIYLWYNGKEIDISDMEPVEIGEGSVGRAIKTGEVIIVDDYLKTLSSKLKHDCIGYDEDSSEPRSTVIAPMKIMGNVIGIIEIQSYDLAAYTEEHATAMRMAANLAANAIENVRLLEQEQQSAEQLRQSQKLESVGRLAGGIAHDFNNMLTAINGYSDLILRQIGNDSPLRSKIEEIKRAGERSAALTHQLLAFSRRQLLNPKVLNINEVIIETSKMLKRLIGEHIQLDLLLNPKIGQIEADPGQLTQVIMNLAVNARDAMPHGGELRIETANIDLDEEFAARHVPTRAGSYVMMAVSDTGTGIDLETQQHIFEPFFTTKETGKGTGLGLAMVYGTVKQSGGYIWVESDAGKGTTFKVYLPRIDEKIEPSEDQNVTDYVRKGNETILLVEDEEIVRNLCRQILESCGYKVIEAANGIDALSICRQADYKIDLLITDVVMPKMSGRILGEQLAVLRPEIKVLYMSGYTDDTAVRREALETGVNFIQKPFTFNALAEMVRDLLDAKN